MEENNSHLLIKPKLNSSVYQSITKESVGWKYLNFEEINRINKSGGNLDEGAAGVPPDQIIKSISYGVCKINIATDLRLLWARVHREFFMHSPGLFDPTIPGKKYIEEFEEFMINKFKLLGGYGKASKI